MNNYLCPGNPFSLFFFPYSPIKIANIELRNREDPLDYFIQLCPAHIVLFPPSVLSKHLSHPTSNESKA